MLNTQFASVERIPSLLDILGDGTTVIGNESLKNERLIHGELGFDFDFLWTRVGMSIFYDRVYDKIVSLPAYDPDLSSAYNLHRTTLFGCESRWRQEWGEYINFEAEYMLLDARDRSVEGESPRIPGVPSHQALLQTELNLKSMSLSLVNRYTGNRFRDSRNSMELPAHWLHDFYVDVNAATSTDPTIGLGAAILNLSDVKSENTSLSQDGRPGRTAVRDLSGQPVAGRHGKVYLTVTF